MFTPGIDPIRYHKVRSQELMREAQHFRMVQEALKARPPRISLTYIMFVAFGKWLVALGTQMERRYGITAQSESQILYKPSPCKE